jgi:hypothetical protein
VQLAVRASPSARAGGVSPHPGVLGFGLAAAWEGAQTLRRTRAAGSKRRARAARRARVTVRPCWWSAPASRCWGLASPPRGRERRGAQLVESGAGGTVHTPGYPSTGTGCRHRWVARHAAGIALPGRRKSLAAAMARVARLGFWVLVCVLQRGRELQAHAQDDTSSSPTSTPALAPVAVNLSDTAEWLNCTRAPALCTSM